MESGPRHALLDLAAVGTLTWLAAVGTLAWPATATAKEGAMFNPQMLSLASGQASRRQLYVMSVIAGHHTTLPAPAPGSVPIVILKPDGRGPTLRFTGTRLDGSHRSLVRLEVPASRVSQRWIVSVQADGHVYPDRIDSPVVSTPALHLPHRSASSSPPWWPVLVAAALLAVGTALIVRRMQRRPWQAQS